MTSIKIRKQIQRDTEFLARHNLMDYSLLVGISRYGSLGTSIESLSVYVFVQ
jgi:hypothetical protein